MWQYEMFARYPNFLKVMRNPFDVMTSSCDTPNHYTIYNAISTPKKETGGCIINFVATDTLVLKHQWPLLLTWFNFNPSMDK